MGRLTRLLAAAALATAGWVSQVTPAAAFDGFGETAADSDYGRQIRFDVTFDGPPPDRLELLIRTPSGDGAFVVPVEPDEGEATYIWNTSQDYVTPNTLVSYQWRATDGDEESLSAEATIRYEDDRPELDWQTAALGETTVHWYGDAEAQAMRFGELAAIGVEQGERLLGTELAGPVDVFVYDSQEDFFGALGPGVREWTGAAAFSEIRTIFMWLGAGSADFLEVAMLHEITHIVFFDATDNPYHEPALWVNEGIAVWSETGDAANETQLLRAQVASEGLFAFDALTARFPIGDLEGSLSYAQGASMIDSIIDSYGADAIARLTAAYREGASDAEALEAATGVPAEELYAAFYADFGIDPPVPVEPEPIAASNVEVPEPGELDPGGAPGPSFPGDPEPTPADPAGGEAVPPWAVVVVLVAAVAVVGLAAVAIARRAARRPSQ